MSLQTFALIFVIKIISAHAIQTYNHTCGSDNNIILDQDEMEIVFDATYGNLMDCNLLIESDEIITSLTFTSFNVSNWEYYGTYMTIYDKQNYVIETIKEVETGESFIINSETITIKIRHHCCPTLKGLFKVLLKSPRVYPGFLEPWEQEIRADRDVSAVRVYTLSNPGFLEPWEQEINSGSMDSLDLGKDFQNVNTAVSKVELVSFSESYGETALDKSSRVILPKSYIPSCHAKLISECGWIIGTFNLEAESGDSFVINNVHGEFMSRNYITAENICLHVEYKIIPGAALLQFPGYPMFQPYKPVNEVLFHLLVIPFSNTSERILIQTKSFSPTVFLENFNVRIPDDLTLTKFKLVLNIENKENAQVRVRKIYGCNPYSKVDRYEISNATTIRRINNFPRTQDLFTSDKCKNMGKLNNASRCVCPVGFMGPACEIGCGENRFGPFCKDHCSDTKKFCKNMVFCKQNIGCFCAPGYKGNACQKRCDDGEYGNGCKEKCGHCKYSNACNIYTGICTKGCVSGFVPPYCKSKYVYLETKPVVSNISFTSATINISLSSLNIQGEGLPQFYQLQYKEIAPEGSWTNFKPYGRVQEIPESQLVVETLEGLSPGHTYGVTSVIYNEKLMTYNGDDLNFVQFTTQCKAVNLNVTVTSVGDTEITIKWKDISTSKLKCPPKTFQVAITTGLNWDIYYTNESEFSFTELAPDTTFQIRVSQMEIPTQYYFTSATTIPTYRTDLQVVELNSTCVKLSWQSHPCVDYFTITYKDLGIVQTDKCCLEAKTSYMKVNGTMAVVNGLRPHSQYIFELEVVFKRYHSFEDKDEIFITTPSAVPGGAPVLESVKATNSTVLVSWQPPEDCCLYNGFILGYHYVLLNSADSIEMISDSTKDSALLLEGLQSSIQYTIKVYLTNNVGWNRSVPLVVDFITKSSVPSRVIDLSVYKRGRNMVGLRWAEPKYLSGLLDSFTVTTDSQKLNHKPQHCKAWPDFYCYTLQNLQPESSYNISVTARNDKIAEDGIPSYIFVETVENSPEMVVNMSVVNITGISIDVRWEPPFFFNGILRSFLIKIEQTESFKKTECCQYYPKTEIIVKEELPEYRAQISGLNEGSTYALSVMAETVWLGPPARISVSTRPPQPPQPKPPTVATIVDSEEPLVWPESSSNEDLYDDGINNPIAGRLLVVLPPEGGPRTKCKENDLQDLVEKALNTSLFYVAAEFNEEEDWMKIGENSDEVEGKWADIVNPTLDTGLQYRLAIIHLSTYSGLFSISTLVSLPFTY